MKSSLLLIALALLTIVLPAPATAQDSLQFTGIERQTNGEVVLKLNGPAGVNYRVDAASDLTGWISLVTLRSAHRLSGALFEDAILSGSTAQ
jgi:hypothetical protein